ncbi:MAG: spore germination protein [Carboxydocellales bacterium]
MKLWQPKLAKRIKQVGRHHNLKEKLPPKDAFEKCGDLTTFTFSLEENISKLQEIFRNCTDVVFRRFVFDGLGKPVQCALIYINGIVETAAVNENILRPLMQRGTSSCYQQPLPRFIREYSLPVGDIYSAFYIEEFVSGILKGSAGLLFDGYNEALLADVGGGEYRSVEEPAAEVTIRGPRDSFTENIKTNVSLIRRRVRNAHLRTEAFHLGKQTQLKAVLIYIDGIANPRVVEEVRQCLNTINMDGIVGSSHLIDLIVSEKRTPFPLINYTERPDRVVGQLLEGRVAITVDGTPVMITLPVLFVEFLQSPEDYYENTISTSVLRVMRIIALNMSLILPALYVAIITFHQEMIPASLLISIAGSKEEIPFPTIIEALIMEFTFEILREAGIRLPRATGQAVSIVGALVIGEAAVQAGIVSQTMVMVVALTGICSFAIPQFSGGLVLRLLRFLLIILAGVLGLVGIVAGLLVILIHIVSLKSFGVPYLAPIAPLVPRDLTDVYLRAPVWAKPTRPKFIGKQNPIRLSPEDLLK